MHTVLPRVVSWVTEREDLPLPAGAPAPSWVPPAQGLSRKQKGTVREAPPQDVEGLGNPISRSQSPEVGRLMGHWGHLQVSRSYHRGKKRGQKLWAFGQERCLPMSSAVSPTWSSLPYQMLCVPGLESQHTPHHRSRPQRFGLTWQV